jgi:hypothetical protein
LSEEAFVATGVGSAVIIGAYLAARLVNRLLSALYGSALASR